MPFHTESPNKKPLRAWTLQRLMARVEAAESESYIATRLETEMGEKLPRFRATDSRTACTCRCWSRWTRS